MPGLTGIATQVFLATTLCLLLLGKARAQELRLLTWTGYAPKEVISQFYEETGIRVKVTLSNNQDIIDRLRASRGSDFDLVQPSLDRVSWIQKNHQVYKPVDLNRIDQKQFTPALMEVVRQNASVDGEVYALPHVWGTNGLIARDPQKKQSFSFQDVCSADYEGKVSVRLQRPTLIGLAFSMGENPFSAYSNQARYQEILGRVTDRLIQCKNNIVAFWSGGEALLNKFRRGDINLAMGWDAGGWKLHQETGNINYVAPESGALGWIDTFAIPARSKNDDAAYQWINFIMRPEIAAQITEASGQFTASQGSEDYVSQDLTRSYKASFSGNEFSNIKWYPPVPEGIEAMEKQAIAQIRAAF